MPITEHKKIALLIDAENIPPKYIELIFDEISRYGFATYKRVYGSAESLNTWKLDAFRYAMIPVMQFNYTNGKNASDSALIIDAMDILYTGNVEGFCLVTSDSDFTKLAMRLREAGMFVMGMGEQKTPESLMRACEEFKYLDILYRDSSAKPVIDDGSLPAKPEAENILPSPDKLKDEISRVLGIVSHGNEWINLAELGNALPKNIPGFNLEFYGCVKLKQLIMKFGDRFELKDMKPSPNSVPVSYVRDKQQDD